MRPTEVRAVVALLSEEAEDETALAKAVIKTLDEMRQDYDAYSVNIQLGGLKHSMGPFSTEHQANVAVMSMLGSLDEEDALPFVTKMINPRLLKEPPMVTRLKAWCLECKHPMAAHDWPSARVPRGCMVGYVAGESDSGCQCGRV